jgi:hypothetical protein
LCHGGGIATLLNRLSLPLDYALILLKKSSNVKILAFHYSLDAFRFMAQSRIVDTVFDKQIVF